MVTDGINVNTIKRSCLLYLLLLLPIPPACSFYFLSCKKIFCPKSHRKLIFLLYFPQRENQFTTQAGKMVKMVIKTKFVPDGGPAMLSIEAMHSIINIPQVKVS